MRTVLHLSDIHFGRFDPEILPPLVQTIDHISPDIVVVSGDLTQRAKPAQFEEAREFLAQLPTPQIVVPGNHDVPLHNPLARVYHPLRNYRHYITDDLHPFYFDAEIAILGINTARSLIWKNGRVNRRQIARIQEHFCGIRPGMKKVLVTHHPFDLPPQHADRDLVGRAKLAMQTIADCGVDILLAGHFHVGHSGHTAVRYKKAGHASIFVQAGTLSTRGRGEPKSFNLLRVNEATIAVDRYWWSERTNSFERMTTEDFELAAGGWSRSEGT